MECCNCCDDEDLEQKIIYETCMKCLKDIDPEIDELRFKYIVEKRLDVIFRQTKELIITELFERGNQGFNEHIRKICKL